MSYKPRIEWKLEQQLAHQTWFERLLWKFWWERK